MIVFIPINDDEELIDDSESSINTPIYTENRENNYTNLRCCVWKFCFACFMLSLVKNYYWEIRLKYRFMIIFLISYNLDRLYGSTRNIIISKKQVFTQSKDSGNKPIFTYT